MNYNMWRWHPVLCYAYNALRAAPVRTLCCRTSLSYKRQYVNAPSSRMAATTAALLRIVERVRGAPRNTAASEAAENRRSASVRAHSAAIKEKLASWPLPPPLCGENVAVAY